MSKLRQIFLNGLKIFLPFVMVYWVLVWLFQLVDHTFAPAVATLLGLSRPITGTGLLAGITLIFLLGLCVRIPLINSLVEWVQRSFRRLPLVKTIFDMTRDIYSFFSKKDVGKGKVVMVDTEIGEMMGIITREDFSEMPSGYGGEEKAAVYFPMSYQIGGFTFMVQKRSLRTLEDVSVEEGMALSMSAGLSTSNQDKKSSPQKAKS